MWSSLAHPGLLPSELYIPDKKNHTPAYTGITSQPKFPNGLDPGKPPAKLLRGFALGLSRLLETSSAGYSGWLLYILVIIPVWSREEVSITFTYSTAISDPRDFFRRRSRSDPHLQLNDKASVRRSWGGQHSMGCIIQCHSEPLGVGF